MGVTESHCGYGDVIMISASDRRLVTVREKDITSAIEIARLDDGKMKHSNSSPVRLVECVKSCHLFGVGNCDGYVYLCVVDECRVSILRRNPDPGVYELMYAFSTDLPTTAVLFTPESLLVTTNKVYEIDLTSFEVSQFLEHENMTDSKMVWLADIRDGEEFLICMSGFGLFIDREGRNSRNSVKWAHDMCGQFFLSNKNVNGGRGEGKRVLWMTYRNAVEAIDLEDGTQKEMFRCKNPPQILTSSNADRVIVVDKKSSDLQLVMRHKHF